ncbi:MAG: hypothetical protein D4R65_13495 [Verrucomicrobiaceae bacterium]|nr:MAG: hypothetical protein D4R65_13495 [Verrucomicrobiaceae bacterium]
MSKARFSLFVFGLYMIFVVGLGFILIPHFVLNLFGLAAGDDVWIRFVGMLASIIGFYYVQVARVGLDRFIPWTVAGRYYAAGFMVLFVVLGKIGLGMLLFAAVDAAAATWTLFALMPNARSDG